MQAIGKVYHLFQFDRSLKVRWLAKELNLSLEAVKLDAQQGEHLKPPFSHLNPFGLVPTYENLAGEIQFEAGAICLSLAREYQPELLDETSNEFNQWLFFLTSSLDQLSGNLISLRVFGDSEDIKSRTKSRLPHKLDALENKLKGQTYWHKNQFSLLDIFAWQNLAYLRAVGELSEATYPELNRYILALAERPALAAFSPEKLLFPTEEAKN
ncbi:glutathione S-transferase family protein [Catenovulum sp. SM1970]|uniref:glutathione S-transferase family protein n=1 Tax=Marinifaba aquimaris TaxID=2741323 RepID=UPI0015729D86|nr:glutathione S-transferase family protein [Marinifaba aquimaris]NTS75288.1 glutathione S-transferase family protein [Marinifaba aquimaris]